MARISVQLYSVRDHWAQDQAGTLARLAEIGFTHVEPFGLGNPDKTAAERIAFARDLRADLDAAGLAVSGVHTALQERLDATLTTLGLGNAAVAGKCAGVAGRSSAEQFDEDLPDAADLADSDVATRDAVDLPVLTALRASPRAHGGGVRLAWVASASFSHDVLAVPRKPEHLDQCR